MQQECSVNVKCEKRGLEKGGGATGVSMTQSLNMQWEKRDEFNLNMQHGYYVVIFTLIFKM